MCIIETCKEAEPSDLIGTIVCVRLIVCKKCTAESAKTFDVRSIIACFTAGRTLKEPLRMEEKCLPLVTKFCDKRTVRADETKSEKRTAQTSRRWKMGSPMTGLVLNVKIIPHRRRDMRAIMSFRFTKSDRLLLP